MDNTILAGKYLRQILTNNASLMELIPASNIFPLIANADTQFPFIVYSRTNLNAVYTKDGCCENKIQFTIIVVSDDYVQSLEIANAVRNALDTYRYSDENIVIDRIHLISAIEETMDDAYIQRMIFSFDAY